MHTLMGAIEDVYADLEADVSEAEFREAVEAKVEQMGGLADEETAAMLIAHELADGEVGGVADIEPEMDEAEFAARVTSVGDIRTFERDTDGDDAGDGPDEGRVLNAEVADETGSVRITFWDERAVNAAEFLEPGQILRVGGSPRDGYDGVEVTVQDVQTEEEMNEVPEIDVQVVDEYRIEDLSMGLSDVNLQGRVLDTDSVRTFDRDDGSEGRVANLTLGDETGRVRVTLWDERADRAGELAPGDAVEVVDGYTRERDGALELHVGDRGRVEELDEEIDYEPTSTPIGNLEDDDIDETVDVAGVVRSADPKRTFDRDDGSEGQVRNVRLQDGSGDIRVALWGEKADADVGPGDELLVTDAEIQDGWQDDIEASAGWRSTLVPLDEGEAPVAAGGNGDSGAREASGGAADTEAADAGAGTDPGLDAFQDGSTPADHASGSESGEGEVGAAGTDTDAIVDADADPGEANGDAAEETEFTGVVVQAGDPVILDDGERTVSVEADGVDVELGEEITVRGRLREGRLDADEVR
jgi:replication factor A1